MSPYLKITRRPYEEPYHLHLYLAASNGRQVSEIDFYIGRNILTDWAEGLEAFPRHRDHVYLWEYGSERPEDKWAYYVRFRFFAVDAAGHCAIHLRLNNNQAMPDREISEFCIRAEAGAINRLGSSFREFSRLEHEVLIWTPTEGRLLKTETEAEQARCSEPGDGDPVGSRRSVAPGH
jgi:hypothetical protein